MNVALCNGPLDSKAVEVLERRDRTAAELLTIDTRLIARFQAISVSTTEIDYARPLALMRRSPLRSH